jgi:probable blue pigment (indigoidine) exporter
MKKLLAGLLFAILWGSGSVATKTGLKAAQPLFLTNVRFVVAATLMLIFAHLIKKYRLPNRTEWLPLFLCGLLNLAVYTCAFAYAMRYITAGLGTLAIATCPLTISLINALWLKQKIALNIWFGLLLGITGIGIAVYPLLLNAHATPLGILLISSSMVCYSLGAVYYQSIQWHLPRIAINGWQALIAALLLLPITAYNFESSLNTINTHFCISIFWLVIPISIIAIQLWLYLLKVEPIKASLWLFLCPIFGFLFGRIFLNEPITTYTLIGTILVIIGLYLGQNLGQRKK